MQFQLALSVRQTGKSSSTATTVNTSKRAYRLASASEIERRGPFAFRGELHNQYSCVCNNAQSAKI